MPDLLYPTNDIPDIRRGYYISPGDIRTTVSALWGESINFRFDVSEGNVSAGSVAEIVLTVTNANIANGVTFTLADQLFTSDTSIAKNTDTNVNFNQSDAGKHAQNLTAAILSNLYFIGKATAVITGSGTSRTITITWMEKGVQYSGSNTMPSPYSIVSDDPGSDAVLMDDYKLVYLLWILDGANKPITAIRAIQPVINPDQQYSTIEIEVNDPLRPYVSLDFPYSTKNVAALEPNARRKFWIQYGYSEQSGGRSHMHDLMETLPEWCLYAAVQETDRYALLPYLGNDSFARQFLTKRPNFNVCRQSIGWLYILLDDNERYSQGVTSFSVYTDYWNGTTWVNLSITALGSVDGIYRIPAHPGNLPTALPSTSSRYRIRVLKTDDNDTYQITSKTWDVKPCCGFQVWFLGDLCSYEDLVFDEMAEESESMDVRISAMPINLFDNDDAANYGARLSTGGRQVVYARNYRKYTGRILKMCDEETAKAYLEMFLKSPFKYIRFSSASTEGTDDLQRSIFVDPDSVILKRDGDLVDVEISFYFHKELAVQI